MGKSAILLIMAGLALGLWLGFNPTTHRALVRWWNHTATAQQAENPSGAGNLRQLDRGLAQWFRAERRPAAPPPAESNPVPSGAQISATLQAFWRALQEIGIRFLMRLGISRN